jgi:hypothetical protein
MTPSTHAHVVAGLRDAPRVGADEQIRAARRQLTALKCGPNTAHEPIPGQSTTFDSSSEQQKTPRKQGVSLEEPTGGLEPGATKPKDA